jgi:hypothetical protein
VLDGGATFAQLESAALSSATIFVPIVPSIASNENVSTTTTAQQRAVSGGFIAVVDTPVIPLPAGGVLLVSALGLLALRKRLAA